MIGRGGSGYRGIGYGKERKSKPWRVKVGRKTITRFARLSDACEYVADHAHVLYPKEFPGMYPNVPTTDPDRRSRVRRKPSAPEEQPQEQPQTAHSQSSATSGSNAMAPSAAVTAAFLERTERDRESGAILSNAEINTLDDDPETHKL